MEGREKANAFRQGECTRRGPLANGGNSAVQQERAGEDIRGCERGGAALGHSFRSIAVAVAVAVAVVWDAHGVDW